MSRLIPNHQILRLFFAVCGLQCSLRPSIYAALTLLCTHSQLALHMPFQRTCGSRGKAGPQQRSPLPVFQNRRIAQLRFRKLRTPPTVAFANTLRPFPLFLVELRVLLSFSLILLPVYYYPSHPAHTSMTPSAEGIASSMLRCGNAGGRERKVLIFQRTVPVFHAHLIRGMNTIEERKYSRFRQALSCCRVWPVRKAATGPGVQGCRSANLKWKSRSHRGQPWRLP